MLEKKSILKNQLGLLNFPLVEHQSQTSALFLLLHLGRGPSTEKLIPSLVEPWHATMEAHHLERLFPSTSSRLFSLEGLHYSHHGLQKVSLSLQL
jgi:hypothetical protein